MGKIILVTGGARSGKSRFAEEYAAHYGKKIAYIATAEIYDEEMRYRVKLHRQRRPEEWDTYEAPQAAEKAIAAAGKEHDMLLFDCLTIYTSNMLCHMEGYEDEAAAYKRLEETYRPLLAAAKSIDGTIIFVTNETGQGIVPTNRLARLYRDLAGLANQWVAEAADQVFLVSCGIPVDIKQLAFKLN